VEKYWEGNTIKFMLFLSEARIKYLSACIVTNTLTSQVSFQT